MRALLLACLLSFWSSPTLADKPICVSFQGAELFEIATAKALEKYLKTRKRSDQVKACDMARRALDAWNQGVAWCNDRPHCRAREFRDRCKLSAAKAEKWYKDQGTICTGL